MGIGRLIPGSLKKWIKMKAGVEQKIAVEKMIDEIAERKIQFNHHLVGGYRFKDKVVVITGGTGSIGSDLCRSFAAEGAQVIICGRNQNRLEEIVNDIIARGQKAKGVSFDITSAEEIETVFADIITEYESIDILINCAGGSARDGCELLTEQKVEVIDEMLNLNLRAPILCSRIALKSMIEKKHGSIVNFSSLMGLRGKSGYVEYGAAKAGIEGLTKALAVEVGKYNINVNCVTPSYVPRIDITYNRAEELRDSNYMNTMGAACDISSAVLYLVSEEAHFITGQNLIVDGGRSLGLKGE